MPRHAMRHGLGSVAVKVRVFLLATGLDGHEIQHRGQFRPVNVPLPFGYITYHGITSFVLVGQLVIDIYKFAFCRHWQNGRLSLVLVILHSTANLKIVMVDKRVTIASGTESVSTTVIDLSEYIPTGKHIHTIADVALGNYSLPYVGNDGTTMTFLWQTNEKNIEIKNKATVWTNYRIRAVLFLADD